MDKIKKLSDAIRLGATFRPQCFRMLFKDGGSCATGAAYEALTGIGSMKAYMTEETPFAVKLLTERFALEVDLIWKVQSRNDHGQTREEIADWLEDIGH